MGRPKGGARVFTDEVLKMIPRWVAAGTHREVIAEALGTTVDSLKTTCSRHGISLRPPPDNLETMMRRALGDNQYQKLLDESRQRGVEVADLVVGVISSVIQFNLFASVLADYDDLDSET